MLRQQLTEVLSRYGEMVEVFFDGSSVVPVADILRKYAPHAMIANMGQMRRFAGLAMKKVMPSIRRGTRYLLPMRKTVVQRQCTEIRMEQSGFRRRYSFQSCGQIGFGARANEHYLLSLDSLLEIYYRSNGRGAQLLVNIPPNSSGLMPAADRARAREFGNEIRRRFGRSVAETRGSGDTVMLALPSMSQIDHVVIQEDCSLGERVRGYRLETRSGGRWKTVGTGSAIGHKRIQPIDPTVADAVRLTATERAAEPQIRRLAAFNTNSLPPPMWDAAAGVPAR